MLEWTDWLVRLLVATALSGLIGFERESHRKSAGFRTHMLVGLGAAVFAVLSVTSGGDPARISAQVVTGVGFLGAGAIFRAGPTVKGLTTAAGLWAVASIGLAAGMGEEMVAVGATGIVISVLYVLTRFEDWVTARREKQGVMIRVDLADPLKLNEVVAMVDKYGELHGLTRVEVRDGGTLVTVATPPEKCDLLQAMLSTIDGASAAIPGRK